jgi:hypothetical protein
VNLLKPTRSVALFLYRFVVGDDPIVAVLMLIALGITAALVSREVNAWWLVPPVAVAMTGLSIWRRNRQTAHPPA